MFPRLRKTPSVEADPATEPLTPPADAADTPEQGGEAIENVPWDDGKTVILKRPLLVRLLGGVNRHKKLLIVLVVILAVAGVFLWRARRAAQAAAASVYQYVRTTTLQKGSLNDSVTVTGTVVSGDEANVTVADAAKTYKVATVEVEVGDEVQQGDVIATLDTTDLQKQIEDAEQSYADTLQSAQTSYDRAVDDYNTSVVQHDNNLIDLQAKIEDADEALADAEENLEAAQNTRNAAQSTRDSSQSTVDSLQSAYNATQGVAEALNAYDTAADALTTAVNGVNNAYTTFQNAYMAYQATPADDAVKNTMLQAANDLMTAWQTCGCTALDTTLNAQVSAANQRAVSGPVSDWAQTEALLSTLIAEELIVTAPSDIGAIKNFNDAASALVTQESTATAGTGLNYQQVIDQYTAAKQALSAAETALTQAESAVKTAETQVESAESQVKSAHDAYDNEKNYSNIKTKAQSVEDAKTKLDQAKRTPDTLETLRDTLADCTLTATMSGTVTALDATVGSTCAGTVATIQDTSALVVEVTIPADDVPALATGMTCLITSDATGDEEIAGTLAQIDPVANEQGTFGAKVRVTGEAGDLLIGIQAQVEIIKSQVDDVYVVPMDAVGTAEDGSSYVLRRTGGEGVDMIFEEVTVTTGEGNDYYVTISGDDLAEGDVIRSSADLSQGIVTASGADPMEEMMVAMEGQSGPNGGMGGDRPDMGDSMQGGRGGAGGAAPGGM